MFKYSTVFEWIKIVLSSGISRHVTWYKFSDLLEEIASPIFPEDVTAGCSEACVNKPTFGFTRPLQSLFSEIRILHFDTCYMFADLGKIDN